MKYRVIIHYEGSWDVELNAQNEEVAQDAAMMLFENASAAEVLNNMADCFVCDCMEVKNEN